MSRSTRRARFLLLAPLVPRAALACGACVDQEVRVWLPFAPAFMVLCLAWIISVIVMRNIIKRRTSAKASEMPWRKALVAFELLATVGFIAVAFISMGSILGASPHFSPALVWPPVRYAGGCDATGRAWELAQGVRLMPQRDVGSSGRGLGAHRPLAPVTARSLPAAWAGVGSARGLSPPGDGRQSLEVPPRRAEDPDPRTRLGERDPNLPDGHAD